MIRAGPYRVSRRGWYCGRTASPRDSRHTIKSEATSIYRKLGTSSRSQAVARSRALGLLEG